MVGGTDIIAAAIAYCATDWKTYLASTGSLGIIAIITGLITVQKANLVSTEPAARKSHISEISLVAKKFFTSGEILRTTLFVVREDEEIKYPNKFKGTILTTALMCQFGLSISVGNLAGDPFINFALLGTAG